MKTTKNIYAIYTISTRKWVVLDNHETIAEGQGLESYAEARKQIMATTTKQLFETLKW